MNFESITPYSALLGGLFIGMAVSLLLLFCGRVAGISGFFHRLLPPRAQRWQLCFLIGLLLGGTSFYLIPSIQFSLRQAYPIHVLLIAGFLVGFGTRLGSGCTSGHGVCGVARFSRRSLLATFVFLFTGILTATFITPWLQA